MDNDKKPQPFDGKHWVHPDDYGPHPMNGWFYIALLFWAIAVVGALLGYWVLAGTGLVTGTIAGVRSR